MRALTKLAKPTVLAEHEVQWLAEFLEDPTNATKRYRYRHPEIKGTLKEETADKCAYCESKLGHSSPGDVEHKVPSSKAPQLHFQWDNLTLACQECNRRKNAFYDEHDGFLDPYSDDVEDLLEHLGPIVTWKTGENRAEVCVNILELSSAKRLKLFEMKLQKLLELCHVLERYSSSALDSPLRDLLARQVRDMAAKSSEYSSMVRAAIVRKGFGGLL